MQFRSFGITDGMEEKALECFVWVYNWPSISPVVRREIFACYAQKNFVG
jgi:hypothetical protein